mmetsp:Transcript_130/g.528  ORF Transcript_130/g.528 Transcript_130/m.528 type:complete len:254 (+) Transcript_130:763-1524(+)
MSRLPETRANARGSVGVSAAGCVGTPLGGSGARAFRLRTPPREGRFTATAVVPEVDGASAFGSASRATLASSGTSGTSSDVAFFFFFFFLSPSSSSPASREKAFREPFVSTSVEPRGEKKASPAASSAASVSSLARRRRASRARRVFSCARNDTGIASTRLAASRASAAETMVVVSVTYSASAASNAFALALFASSAPATWGTKLGANLGKFLRETCFPHSNVFANATSSDRKLCDALRAAECVARAAEAVFS